MRQYVSLRGRREFALAMRRGNVVSTPALTLYAFSPRTPVAASPKVGVVVTRKVGKAVTRNRVRRRCKAILETLLQPTDVRWYVVACRPLAATTPFAELRRQLSGAIPSAQRPRKRQR
jgi:ribonuclease P protein component